MENLVYALPRRNFVTVFPYNFMTLIIMVKIHG